LGDFTTPNGIGEQITQQNQVSKKNKFESFILPRSEDISLMKELIS
jgi:hypothetical protein